MTEDELLAVVEAIYRALPQALRGKWERAWRDAPVLEDAA